MTETDVLGREPMTTNTEESADYLRGKRVLVSGAGGSIGSQLCQMISLFAPSELVMVDNDRPALQAVEERVTSTGLATCDPIQFDIRDKRGLEWLIRRRRPEVVFHCAAIKHLPALEGEPRKAVETNVWGTLALLEASAAAGVRRFVNISTIKVVDTTTVLGCSKRLAERLTSYVAKRSGASYVSVRLGNVMGTQGSVLELFEGQIAKGGPITVTDPEVTRYFMSVEEAVGLTIRAAAIGRGGEALMLDMGQPVKIADVARRMAAQSRVPIDVVFTGLRAGEKRQEGLLSWNEVATPTDHAGISCIEVPPLEPDASLDLDLLAEPAELAHELRELCARSSLEFGSAPDDLAVGNGEFAAGDEWTGLPDEKLWK